MDAQQFLAEFKHIANAPGGVARLRELVLQIAISGQLVKQLPGDSDVKRSLVELRNRRHKLLDEKGLSATRKHKNLEEPEGWLPVPNSWHWEALGYLSLWPLKDGDWIESKDQDLKGDVRIVQLADVGVGTYKDRSNRFLTSTKAVDLGCYFLERNDVLIARLPDPLGRACIFPGDKRPSVTVVDVAVCRCDPEIINPRFLMNCLNSPAVSNLIKSWAVGTTRQRVATGRLGSIALPIAPIEEQSRIVAKVDELMALCDQLEAQQQARRKLQNALRQSTLQALASAQSPHELQDSWQRLQANLGCLFSEPGDVGDLRRLLWDMAVRGFISEASPKDTPALATFERIKNLEGDLVRKKLMARPKPFPALSTIDEPFGLPDGWLWVRLGELAPDFQNGLSKRHGESGEETTVLRLADMANNEVSLAAPRKIRLTEDEREKYLLRQGDILITRVNGSAEIVGSFVKVDVEEVAYCDHFIRMRLLQDLVDVNYIWLASRSPFVREQIAGKFVTTAGQKTVNQNHIGSVLLPLPPVQEQGRIVARIGELIRFCDALELQLRDKSRTAQRLATSAISVLSGITMEQEKEAPVKAPQTELIAPLRLGSPPDVKAQAPLATLLVRHNGEMSARDLWQRFGGEIDAFYAQLKTEVAHGWIAEPAVAEVREKSSAAAGA